MINNIKLEDGTDALRFNLSIGKPNHSQRNNTHIPMESCNVTSYAMALEYRGYLQEIHNKYPKAKTMQLEDFLYEFITSNESVTKKFNTSPLQKMGIPVNQSHYMLEYMVDVLFGRNITDFKTDYNMMTLLNSMKLEKPIILSGKFKHHNGYDLSHIVCGVGFITTQLDANINIIDESKVTHIIVDDPFGNMLDGYRSHMGNDVAIPITKFKAWFKNLNKPTKWAHILV